MMITKKSKLFCTIYLCLIAVSFIGCSKDDGIKELKLSTTTDTVYTDSIAYTFDIVSGNGNYQVTVNSDGDRSSSTKAIVKNNHVSINLLKPSTQVTVTDAAGQSANLEIVSNNKSLATMETSVGVSYGYYLKSKLNWGNGGYRILSQSNDVASVTIDNEGHYIAKGLRSSGSTTLLISDERGTTNYMTIEVGNGTNISNDALTYSIPKKEAWGIFTFPIKYGVGDWKIVSCSDALRNPFLIVLSKNEYADQDVLQISIPKESEMPLTVQLEDRASNHTTLTINTK